MQFERAVSAAFSFGMAALFLFSFFFPQETSQWLIRIGAPLIFTELASLSIIPILGTILGKRTGAKGYETGWLNWFWLLFDISIILMLAAYYRDIYLFAYFLLSLLVKFLDFRSRKEVIKPVAAASIAATILAASFVIALAFSWVLLMYGLASTTFYPAAQEGLLAVFSGGLTVLLVGFLYFSLTGAYQLSPPGHWFRLFWLRLSKL